MPIEFASEISKIDERPSAIMIRACGPQIAQISKYPLPGAQVEPQYLHLH